MNFKTYDEFVKDKKNEIIELIDYEEKLEIYNKYCKTKDNYYSPSHNNTEESVKLVFEGDLNTFAQDIPHKTYSAIKTLDDIFVDNELIDFTMDYINVDFEDLYDTYVCDVIEDAKMSMPLKEFLNTLKGYLNKETMEKYPIVYDNIYYGYSYYTLDKTNEKDNTNEKDYWKVEFNEDHKLVPNYRGQIVTTELIDTLRQKDIYIKNYNLTHGKTEFGETTNDYIGYFKFYFDHYVDNKVVEQYRIDIGDGAEVNESKFSYLEEQVIISEENSLEEKYSKESEVKFIVKGLKGLRYLKDSNIKDNNKLER